MIEPVSYLFLTCIVLIAFLYSSVGHGGASGYIALMALFSVGGIILRPAALVMNIAVSSVAFFHFYKEGYLRWKLFFLFTIASVPAAFIGGSIPLPDGLFKTILGIVLIIPFLRLLLPEVNLKSQTITEPGYLLPVAIGTSIGFLSGMIGIGGGIILSPILLLFRWANMKETAAISAGFILVNSLSGIAAAGYSNINPEIIYWTLAVLVGGYFGSYLGAGKYNQKIMKNILAAVLFIAIIKLLTT